jgi:hypothetical protein
MKDNELTKRKLIDAVGSIIRSKVLPGYALAKLTGRQV